MYRFNRLGPIFVSASIFVLLTACGGGGSSNDDDTGTVVDTDTGTDTDTGDDSNTDADTDTAPSVDAGVNQSVGSDDAVTLTASVSDNGTTTISWSQTSGTSVALSGTSSATASFTAPTVTASETLVFEVSVDDGVNATVSDTVSVTVSEAVASLPNAYLWFGANVTVALDGDEVVLEATGRPDHTSTYWNPDNSSGLYVEADPDITTVAQMSPGYIENYTNLYTLRVPLSPVKASSTSATSLGAVGIAVSGAPIFNDQEGPNVDLDIGVISGFDRNGAHTGPETYHYHLEPKAITNDDEALVGLIADGFFLYGRKCYSTGTYPTDLDVSGGHTSVTQHSVSEATDEVYHYHIQNDFYLGAYYLLFPEDYQGTPNTISN